MRSKIFAALFRAVLWKLLIRTENYITDYFPFTTYDRHLGELYFYGADWRCHTYNINLMQRKEQTFSFSLILSSFYTRIFIGSNLLVLKNVHSLHSRRTSPQKNFLCIWPLFLQTYSVDSKSRGKSTWYIITILMYIYLNLSLFI